jgi:gentisate 1,2-dioxygenase
MPLDKRTESPDRKAFYEAIAPENLRALWPVLGELVTRRPVSGCKPHLWGYDKVRARLLEASHLITAEEAERRVLILENPGLAGSSRATTSLYAGVQLVMPGEVAPAHRHSQSALRFVLEADAGSYTSVGGEKTDMHYGDFVITPNWAWHDHGNDGAAPVLWLDGLDIPLVQFLDASFAERAPDARQAVDKPTGDSLARYGANMLPVDHVRSTHTSPIFNYPYDRSREALEVMRRRDEWDACHGLKMRYVNPEDGGWAMPTIGAMLQLLPAGFTSESYCSSDATVFAGVEGRGRARIAGQVFEWGARDVFVCPSWHEIVHEVEQDAVLFSYSDRPVQEKLGLWREARGDDE